MFKCGSCKYKNTANVNTALMTNKITKNFGFSLYSIVNYSDQAHLIFNKYEYVGNRGQKQLTTEYANWSLSIVLLSFPEDCELS